jgi:hypothetical protein
LPGPLVSNGGVRNPPTSPSTTITCASRFTASRNAPIVIADISANAVGSEMRL